MDTTVEDDKCTEPSPLPSKRPLCAQCERPCRVCWCDTLPRPRISLATQIVVLQHPDECRRSIRTARMLELGLSPDNCVVYRGKKFPPKGEEEEESALRDCNSFFYFFYCYLLHEVVF